jgi:TatD DNase family protein
MAQNQDGNFVYFLDGKTYINLTNACTNRCRFCVRDIKDDVLGANLRLNHDNVVAEDVISQLEALKENVGDEIIFCGYGEPLLKLEELKKIAHYAKNSKKRVRINTNGHASFVHKKNVPEELRGIADEISISLNAENEEVYNEISRPEIGGAYEHMKEFARQCVCAGIKTTMSVVTGFRGQEVDIEACRAVCEHLGAEFRVREWVKEGY